MNKDKKLILGKSLYPEILFHFCEKDALFNILNSTFKISYAREKIIGETNIREIGVPMVSFCDLRLSEVISHMCKYGNYGIGLTKEWANRKGLNPVLYISKYSPLTDGLISGLNGVHAHIRRFKDTDSLANDFSNIHNVYRFIKNYEAPLKKRGYEKIDKYRFADEREWRYVPPLEDKRVVPFVSQNQIRTAQQKEDLNKEVESVRLHFQPEDIRYLIVNSDNEISELIEHLVKVKQINFTAEALNRLKSRILTFEQIQNDI